MFEFLEGMHSFFLTLNSATSFKDLKDLFHTMSLNIEPSSRRRVSFLAISSSSQHHVALPLNGTLMQTPGPPQLGVPWKDQRDLHQHFLSIPDPGLLTLWGVMPTFSAANLTELFLGSFIPFN